jgi:hypothetical protein
MFVELNQCSLLDISSLKSRKKLQILGGLWVEFSRTVLKETNICLGLRRKDAALIGRRLCALEYPDDVEEVNLLLYGMTMHADGISNSEDPGEPVERLRSWLLEEMEMRNINKKAVKALGLFWEYPDEANCSEVLKSCARLEYIRSFMANGEER